MRYFVHLYHVVRSKVLVEADSQVEAIKKAEEAIPMVSERVGYHLLSSLEEEVSMAPGWDADSLPVHLQTESAEEVTGYLVDELGDEDSCENSRTYDSNGELEGPADTTLKVTPAERDTILAALRFWQRLGTMTDPEYDIALNGHGVDDGYALDDEAIDDLCERINT